MTLKRGPAFHTGGTLRRWNGSTFKTGGTLRRWDGTQFRSESSSFSPGQLANLVLWLKADAITGLSNGATVSSWPDSSGAGHDGYVDPSYAGPPSYATNVLNGLPTVRFVGSATSGNNLALRNLGNALSLIDTYSVYIVARSSIAIDPVLMTWPANQQTWEWLIEYSGSGFFWGQPFDDYWEYTGTTISGDQWAIAEFVKTAPTTGHFYVHGTEFTGPQVFGSGLSAAPVMTGDVQLGSYENNQFGINGDVAEIIIVTHASSDTERGKIEAYLEAKWGL